MDEQKYVCPHCGQLISYGETPCQHCGKAVSWADNNDADKQKTTSEEVTKTTEESGKPWKKIIILFILCYAVYSGFFAGNGTPEEYFKEMNESDHDKMSSTYTTYLDELGEDKAARRKAGYEFASLVSGEIAFGKRGLTYYENLQFNLDKYPELSPLNSIGTLALRYSWADSQRRNIENQIGISDYDLKKEIISKMDDVQVIDCYVPGKLNGTDDFLGLQYHYFFGSYVPDPLQKAICTFINNPDNIFDHFGQYYVRGIVLNDQMNIKTATGISYQVPRVYVVSNRILDSFGYYRQLNIAYQEPSKDTIFKDRMNEMHNHFVKLMNSYKDNKVVPLTYSGKNMDTKVKEALVGNAEVVGTEDRIVYVTPGMSIETNFGLREDPQFIFLLKGFTGILPGNLKIGSTTKDVTLSYLKNSGYTYEEVGDTVRVLSPNAEIWRFYFKDNLLGHIEITRDLNYMDSAY